MSCSLNYQYTYSNVTHTFTYDLCPLFIQHQPIKHEIIEDTPPTQTKYVYDMALGNGIKKDGTLPVDLQCPLNSFICLTVFNTRPNHSSEPPRILQVVPVASGEIRPKFRATNTTTGSDLVDTHLQVTVHGLEYMKQKQKAVFHMQCTEGSDDAVTDELAFLYNWNGTHVFLWKTVYGCPKIIPLRDDSQEGPDHENGPDESLPPTDPEPDSEYPRVSGPSISPWFWAFTIICSLVVLRATSPGRYQHHLRRFKKFAPYWCRRIPGVAESVFLEENSAENEMQPLNRYNKIPSGYQRYMI